MRELVSVDEARAIIQKAVEPLVRAHGTERVPLLEAVGRILARDAVSAEDHPPFRNSAMDGYALAPGAGGESEVFRIVGESRAGVPFQGRVHPGEAVRIATGAVIPEGAELVLPVELVQESDGRTVSFERMLPTGSNVRPQGKDIAIGTTAVARGSRIKASVVPMLAMLGIASPEVALKPRVAVVTTGDELVSHDVVEKQEGTIRDANAPGLAALATAAGAAVVALARAGDSPDALAEALDATSGAQVLLISGGVSVGQHDHVKAVLARKGYELAFWRVRQRPGKPLAFGMRNETLVFALPGNPVSTAVCFDQYVRPALEAIMALEPDPGRTCSALLEESITSPESLHHMIRGKTRFENSRLYVRPTGAQDSNLVSSIAAADCLIHIPEGVGSVSAGSPVTVEWWRY